MQVFSSNIWSNDALGYGLKKKHVSRFILFLFKNSCSALYTFLNVA